MLDIQDPEEILEEPEMEEEEEDEYNGERITCLHINWDYKCYCYLFFKRIWQQFQHPIIIDKWK